MGTRMLLIVGAVLLGAAVVLGGAGMALGWGGQTMMGASPMSGRGMGGMMGPNGHGGMMGNSQQTPAAAPVTGVTQISIRNFAYTPSNIQVAVGTTVTWTNSDTAPHSVTFKNGTKDSGLLRQGQSFSYTFTTPGTYDYYCTVHPYMVARVIVTE